MERKKIKLQQGFDKIQSSYNIKSNKNFKCSLVMKKEVEPMRKVISEPKVIEEVINSFSRTTEEIFSLDELKKLLSAGRQLRMKFGVDVTAPDLHIGHAVNLWMYRKLQELGHKVIFLIGDFTTQIGDPTGKSKTRPIIPLEEIKKNAEAFIKQAKMVLHDDPNLVEIRRNSEWYDKLSAKKLLSLMSMVTHDRLMAREMFRKRIQEGKEIYEHELVYPILQGYDSVMLQADLTIIGSDQLYNEMMGRFFQEKFGQAPQVIITTKITPGIDGKEKQSKSLGNYIGLAHSPREKFGRVMSMPDNLIIEYFKVYTEVPLEKIAQMERDLPSDPMKFKLLLAKEIVKRYHGEKVADEELQWFKKTFSERQIPEDAPVISLGSNSASVFEILRKCFTPQEKSNSEIRRLINQGAVKVDGRTVESYEETILLPASGIKLKVGKRNWFKIVP
jgi:tyrosyl-tRNA synthetase